LLQQVSPIRCSFTIVCSGVWERGKKWFKQMKRRKPFFAFVNVIFSWSTENIFRLINILHLTKHSKIGKHFTPKQMLLQ